MAAQSYVLYTLLHSRCKKLGWINDSAMGVQIVMRQRFRKFCRNMDGDITTIDDRYGPNVRVSLFNVPFSVLVSPLLGEVYFWSKLSGLIDDPLPRKYWAQRLASITSSKLEMACLNAKKCGIAVVAEFEVTKIKLVDEETLIDEVRTLSLETSAADCGRKGASKSVIEGLKKEMVKSGDVVGTCVICLDQLSAGSEFTRMACSHVFHHACLIQWLEESNSCPVCRYMVPD